METNKSISKPVFIFSLFLLISFINLDGQVFNVKIKVGVIMKSGDIKSIARQDFLILDADIISDFIKSSESDFGIDFIEVEKTIKEKLDYENKIKMYEDKITSLNDQINSLNEQLIILTKKKDEYDGPELQSQYLLLKKHLKSSIDIGKRWNLSKDFQNYYQSMGNNVLNYNDFMWLLFRVQRNYVFVLEENRNEIFNKVWKNQYEEFKKIAEFFIEREKSIENSIEIIKSEISDIKSKLSENNDKKVSFESKLNLEVLNQIDIIKSKEIDEYRNRFIKSIRVPFKTNLLGEASISLPMGKYYIVGIGQVNENEVIWNSPISIEKDAQYYELSNDNALSINNASIMETIKKLFSRK